MARQKVTGRDNPSKQEIAREFTRDEKIKKLAKEKIYKNKESFRKMFPIDPTIPSWKRGFIYAINAFNAIHDVGEMVEVNIVVEVAIEATKDIETQKQDDATLSTSTLIQIYAPGTDAMLDRASSRQDP